MAPRRLEAAAVWRAIDQAGSVAAYIEQQLRERGFFVERRETGRMSKRERAAYKKQLKDEAAEKKRLKAEAWEAYRANYIVHLGEHVFWNDALDWDKWDLEHAEERAAENELPPLDSPKQLAERLGLSVAELRWLAYHREAARLIHYRRFTIPKRDGSQRAIWSPLTQTQIGPTVDSAEHCGKAHRPRSGPRVFAGAFDPLQCAAHTDSQILLKMDIQNFFPTVTLPRVKGVFRKAGYREQIATLLALLCTESPREIVEHHGKTYFVALGPRCLPQGRRPVPA